jgi:DNA replicative helicase MCM subunit Mcm2 (Cdc46/Mcm family)
VLCCRRSCVPRRETRSSFRQLASRRLKHGKGMQELLEVLQAEDAQRHYGVTVSLLELGHHDAGLVQSIVEDPAELVPLLDDALVLAQEQLLCDVDDTSKLSVKVHNRTTLATINPLVADNVSDILCNQVAVLC